MKQILIAIFSSLLLFSCSLGNKSDQSKQEVINEMDTTVFFSGFWVNEECLNDLAKHKSPRKAFVDKMTSITIPENTQEITRMDWSFHDGGSDMIVIKNVEAYALFNYYSDTIRDLAYKLDVVSDEKLRIGEILFRKTNDAMKVVEQWLFSGFYLSTKGDTIEFRPDGTIMGIEDVEFYSSPLDYMHPASNIDVIQLWKNENEKKTYGFLFNNDTLGLYNLHCVDFDSTNGFCAEHDFGKTVYKLVEIK